MKKITTCLIFVTVLFSNLLIAQSTGTISGIVQDIKDQPLIGTTVFLENTTKGAYTDLDGSFEIIDVEAGEYKIVFTYVGFENITRDITVKAGENTEINVAMGEDALAMDEVVVTGFQDNRTKLESSVAITTLTPRVIQQRNPRGTGELLQSIPGTHVDNSSGEVGAKVYARGLASGVRNQPGFNYVSLQEEGLPVMSTQFNFSLVDMYHRPDATVARFEAVRGGSASIASANAPGGIFNFISKEGGNVLAGQIKFEGGLEGDGNTIFRTDINVGGPLNNSGWFSNFGGFYRYDQGARNLPYNANIGGQLKANLVKKHNNGSLKFYAKFLNDKVSSFQYIPVLDLETAEPFGDFNLNYSTLHPEFVANNLPDGEQYLTNPNATRDYDASKAIKTENYALGFNVLQRTGVDDNKSWLIRNNFKASYAEQNYNEFQGNVVFDPRFAINDFLGLPPLALFVFNDYTYSDLETGEVIYDYNEGDTTLAKLWAGSGFTIKNQIYDIMNQFVASKDIKQHKLTFGTYGSYANVDIEWTGDAVISTLEQNPRRLVITSPNLLDLNPAAPELLYFTNPENGLFGEGSASYNRAEATSSTLSFFASDLWQVNERLNVDVGVRFETVFHKGKLEESEFANQIFGDTIVSAFFTEGLPFGLDGDYTTFYDSGTRIGLGTFREFDFSYSYVSGSLGLNYKINDDLAIYTRFTRGNKSPELSFYIANFVGQDINPGEVEKIYMAETGVKVKTGIGAIFLTGFYSRMNDVGFQLFLPGDEGVALLTPSTFNKIQTFGTELEIALNPFNNFFLNAIITLQDANYVEFNYYNVNGTAHPVYMGDVYPEDANVPGCSPYNDSEGDCIPAGTPSDDFIEQFNGNNVADVPQILADITASYKISRFQIYGNWRFTGKRPANRRNTLDLPGFSMFNAGIDGKITKNVNASIKIKNIFNSAGLMGFDGMGRLGQTPEDLTTELLQENSQSTNPDPLFVRPVLPRIITASVSYEF
ncbi:MAG: TonB-dependent receptor [Bacteroidota bacterium]